MSDKSGEGLELRLLNGKYTVRYGVEDVPGQPGRFVFEALRYGEPWRDLTGDGLVLALVHRIEELEEEIKNEKAAER